MEACALKLESTFSNICVLTLYRAPSGNFDQFLNRLEPILSMLHSPKTEFIICGDISVNYLVDSNRKQNLDSLLLSYNLSITITFPKRVQRRYSAIDNIFIDNLKLENYIVEPVINGLPDHDAQTIEINKINLQSSSQQYQTVRKIDAFTNADFVTQLSYETWDKVFDDKDIDSKFNCFLNTYILEDFLLKFSSNKSQKRNQK
jgi:hypothetical protein